MKNGLLVSVAISLALVSFPQDADAQKRLIRSNCGPVCAVHVVPQVVAVPAVPVVPVAVLPQPPAYGPNWKTDAIKYAEARDDHAAYLATLRSLGIAGQQYSFQQSTYGSVGHSLPAFGANATTNFGYSYNTIAQLYGDTSLTQLYQQSAQLTAGAQKLAGDANQGHHLLVGQEGSNRARIAEILAKAQSAEQILKALNGPNTVQTQTVVTGSGPAPKQEYQLPTANAALEAFQSLIGDRCASCHSGSVKKGGIDLASYLTFDTAQKQRVWASITSMDAKTMMPRNPDGSAGKRLTPAEMSLFFAN